MKKIFTLLSLITIVVLGFLLVRYKTRQPEEALGVVTSGTAPVPVVDRDIELDFEGREFSTQWVEIDNLENLSLIPNFSEKASSKDIKEGKSCSALVSAGFYTKDAKPTGLFISEGDELRDWSKNSLFNGILSVNYFGIPRITKNVPGDPLRIGLQTGPLLIENASSLKLSLKNDEFARRIIAATTGKNTLIFIVVYDGDSIFLGPNLADLPKILEIFQKEVGIEIADAVNLDGGTASSFITFDWTFSEASPVGSFFCIRQDV